MNTSRNQRISLYLVIAILMCAPLIWSGRNSHAMMAMEIAGAITIALLYWNRSEILHIPSYAKWYITVCLGIILIYLLPLPNEIWSSLPGRDNIQQTVKWLENKESKAIYKSISIIPLDTLSLLITCIPAFALFLSAATLKVKHLKLVIYAILASAVFQSLLAMAQYFRLDSLISWLPLTTHTIPTGTYLNQNHLTAYVEIIEPLALALMIVTLINPNLPKPQKTYIALLFAIISLILTFVPLITTSRMGTFLLFVSIILSFWAITTPSLRKRVASAVFALRLALLALFITLQLSIVKSYEAIVRMTHEIQPEVVAGDLRWTLWTTSFQAIKDMFPLGSGPGTFQGVYKQYQPVELHALVEAAHNDYIQLVFEFGLTGIFIIIGAISLFILQAVKVKNAKESEIKIIQSAAGVGVFLFAVFSLTDFNLHTPANTFTLCFILGIYFRQIRVTPPLSN